jgi:5-methylcytosine-specific restriction endonuclease McrA
MLNFNYRSRYGNTKRNEEVFIEESTYPRHRLKGRILKQNLIEYKCQCCGIKDEWNKQKLVLQLDHINGINNDNRLENLRFLCPNCHSQQDTFAARNKNRACSPTAEAHALGACQ